jgi:hypothetical protein
MHLVGSASVRKSSQWLWIELLLFSKILSDLYTYKLIIQAL